MKKKLLICILAILMVASTLIVPALAVKPNTTYDSTYHYTRYVGQLGGAAYEIFMPDNWNGELVIGCRGFILSNAEFPKMDTVTTHQIGVMFMTNPLLSKGDTRFAYAQSMYDEIGFCMQAGMLHTHQLTQYIIDNFGVTGNIYLIGLSMGGQIAQMLVDKHPGLYAGILDVCGNKDTTAFYDYWQDVANLPADPTAIRTYLIGNPTMLPATFAANIPDLTLTKTMREAAAQVVLDVQTEFGGTPESKPQAYDRLSPTCHADLTVPVISMIARADTKVPIQHFNAYYDAVAAAGCLSNYRSYIIPGTTTPTGVTPPTTHCDATIINSIPKYFQQLTDWVNGIAVPIATPRPLA
jgi:pimeloyl-ACP methyl ester carboxylesterase